MSLNAALQIGRSALLTSQTALQVAGDNMANAATKGFHRRSIHLTPMRGQMLAGHSIGQGVRMLAIRREIDFALQSRFRNATSNEHAAMVNQQFLTAMETLQNELSDNDLSSELSAFFNSFSELANTPTDIAVRGLVIQQGQSLAARIATMREDYNSLRTQVDSNLAVNVEQVNGLLTEIATLNEQIMEAEVGETQIGALRDQRDSLINELSQYMDISVHEQTSGAVDIHVNSLPVLLGADTLGIKFHSENVDGQKQVSIRLASDGSHLQVTGGSIGALVTQRKETIEPMTAALETFTTQLIFQVNRIHSQGQGLKGFKSVTGSYALESATVSLNSSASGLPFQVGNGSFQIHVTHAETGVKTTHQIQVDGNTMSLNDLINEINVVTGVPNVTAGVGAGNTLTLNAGSGYEISFSDDTSGALAALGINTFFTGSHAADIGVNQVIVDDPALLAAGEGHVDGSNGTALALANLQDAAVAELGGMSLTGYWQNSVNWLAVRTSAANAAAETTYTVRASIEAQIQSVSGVSLDEESINLLTFQRQYQAAAKYIATIDETMQTLLAL